tara:strand:+ start:113 stop:1420 length:1308 start_codon:yes stop_codon:yes gene_type:complete
MPYHLSDNIKKGSLCLLKHDVEFFSQIVPILNPEYFDFPAYKHLFTGVRDYYEKYRKLPSDSVLPDYIMSNVSGAADEGIDYESVIMDINQMDKSIMGDREFILDAVENFAKNKAMDLAVRKSVAILNEKGDISQVEELVRDALLINRNIDVGQDYFDDVSGRLLRTYESTSETRFPTVFPFHNKELEGGLSRKELAMVVAPPGVGKSLYLVNQGATSILNGNNVLYISCEMSQDKIAGRFDSVLTYLKNSTLKQPQVQLKLKSRLNEVKTKSNGRLVIKEFPTGLSNVNQIRALLVQLRLHKDFVPDLIIVDYLELLRPNRIIDSEYIAQQRITEELRGIAVEQNALVWTATQTNRQARKVSIITDAELGDSYGKIRPADWVISLNQNKEEYDEGAMRVYVMKARDARQHYLINVSVDYSTLQMKEPSSESQAQ